MSIDGFAFEGGQITANALARRIPVYSRGSLQSALEAGCKSVEEVMAFMARRDNASRGRSLVGSRKAKRLAERSGLR